MRVAVTGSNGFLGKEVVKHLRERGFQVTECTRKDCNVLDQKQVTQKLSGAGIVVHCAAQLDEEAQDLFEVNVRGTENVLEASAKNQVEQFIFLSTVGVYGAAKGVKTEASPLVPETSYEKSKLEAEKKVNSYQELFHVTVLRPAIIAGNNSYWRKIIRMVGKGFPLIGKGENKWQLVCVEDVAEAVVLCIGNEACYGEAFNVAEKEGMTLRELAEFIRGELGMGEKVMSIPLWLGKMIAAINGLVGVVPMLSPAYLRRLNRERAYSTEKLRKLGWAAKQSGKECLKKVIIANLESFSAFARFNR